MLHCRGRGHACGGKKRKKKEGVEWRTLGIIRVLHGYCKSDGDATRRCVDDGWRNERTERNCVDLFFFFFFWLRNDRFEILDNRGELADGRGLEEVYSCSSLFEGNKFKTRGFETSFHGYGYKGWKISFRLRSIQRSLLHALYTHRKRSNKDTSNGSGYETRPAPKGMIAKLSFFLSIEKNINIPGIRFQKSFVRPKNTSFKPIHNIPWN